MTDALKHLTSAETINADFDGSGRAMTRRSFIEKLPPILILHLKRFVYDGHGTRKVWKKIAYPLDLEIPLDVISPTQRPPVPPKFQLFGGTPFYKFYLYYSYLPSRDISDRRSLHSRRSPPRWPYVAKPRRYKAEMDRCGSSRCRRYRR